jgi:hypothetical protein
MPTGIPVPFLAGFSSNKPNPLCPASTNHSENSKPTDWSRSPGLPLVTTECRAIVNYKDWPLLDWGWVKELCAHGVEEAVKTGRWTGIATSNFCGPQFTGMWRDVEWHQRLTKRIRESSFH